MTDKLAENIRSLRTAFGETQLELAFVLGMSSPSTVSQYESGVRTPSLQELQKISEHYLVSLDRLLNADLPGIRLSELPFDNSRLTNRSFVDIFPIVSVEEAMRDADFKKAYDAHRRVVSDMLEGKAPSNRDIDICTDAYFDAYDKNDCAEAAANMLWWITLTAYSMKNPLLFEGGKLLRKKRINVKSFLKRYFLKDPENTQADDSEWRDFAPDAAEASAELLLVLSRSEKWSALGSYYAALRYTLAVCDNDLADAESRSIGEEMLWSLAQSGNEYAVGLYRSIRDFINGRS